MNRDHNRDFDAVVVNVILNHYLKAKRHVIEEHDQQQHHQNAGKRRAEPQNKHAVANEEQLSTIRIAHHKVLEKINANKSWFDANTDFHLAVARASGNVAFVYALRAILKSYRGVREAINRFSSTPVEDIRDHTEILEAIEAKDSERAAAAMGRHLRATIQRLDDETVP